MSGIIYNPTERPKVICLMGATATGKTDLAVSLTERLPCELVSVDSALIYKGMDIGTAKPEPEVLAKAPHRLIDILDPAESYSAADFRIDALQAIEEIHRQGKITVLVGGTMLYFKALLEGLADLPQADEGIRAEILQQAQEQGWEAVHASLALVDPESARRIHPNDPQRLQRALEVYLATGRSLTSMWSEQQNHNLGFDVLQLAVEHPDRSVLHRRIEQRFDMMLAAGFEAEVQQLYQRQDLNPSLPSIRCVGYRQMWSHFDNEFDYDTMRERAIIATRQLAKRQLTWLRGWSELHRLDVTQANLLGNALKMVDDYLI